MVLRKGFCFGLVFVVLISAHSSFAQNSSPNIEVKRNVARVLFSTLGGAILGLSTLSFYGEPQEHTDNISVGALLGLIAGTSYVLYKSSQPATPPPSTFDSYGLNNTFKKEAPALARAPLIIQMTFDF